MIFYKDLNDLSSKILKVANDEKYRKAIGRAGKEKYFKHFNSTIVAEFIVNKTLDFNTEKKVFWHN